MNKFKGIQEAYDFLEKGLEDLFKSENYRYYLTTMAKFHQYSNNNIMMIYYQMPGATKLAGYKTWEDEFGRTVKKGEKGIAIFAPIGKRKSIYKKDENGDIILDDEGKPIKEEISYLRFRLVYVYDISQTEGKELPQSPCNILTSDYEDYNILLERLKKISPMKVQFTNEGLGNALGMCDYMTNTITVRPNMSQGQTIKTLIHEEAHAHMHIETVQRDRHVREIEAESVAFVVAQCLGLDTSGYSFGYIANWSKNKKIEELRNSMENIRITSQRILEDLKRCEDKSTEVA